MTSSLLSVAGVPTNLRLPEGSTLAYCEPDLYNICERLRELDEALSVIVMKDDAGGAAFAITERTRQGVEELVMRVGPGCKIDALDARVIEHIEWIRRIPAAERAAQIEREIAAEARSREEQKSEKLYEDIGGSFYDNLFKCGFVTTPKPESRKPMNATAIRAGRRI